jgi:hypothetical protein
VCGLVCIGVCVWVRVMYVSVGVCVDVSVCVCGLVCIGVFVPVRVGCFIL